MTHRFLSHADLTALVAELVDAKTRVIAPVRAKDDPGQLDYLPIQKLEDATFGTRLPRRSMKEYFLPVTEVLLRYRQTKEGVEIKEVPSEAPPTVIFSATPCDASGLDVVDKVMSWDYQDELWFGRRKAATVVSFLCPAMDEVCFCTSVGLGPDSIQGSDVLLVPVEGGYLANVITPKGEALLEGKGKAEVPATVPKPVQRQRKAKPVRKWKPICPRFRPSLPVGWLRISIIRCGRQSRCAVTAAEPVPVSVRPAIASTLSMNMTVRPRACGGVIGIPARPRNLLSMLPDTIREEARTSAFASASSISFRFIPASLERFSVPAAAVAPGLAQAAWIFRPSSAN